MIEAEPPDTLDNDSDVGPHIPDLDIDHRLRIKARNGSGPDVFDLHRHSPQDRQNLPHQIAAQIRPRRIMRDHMEAPLQ
jgi:hypothetical protein